MRAGLRKLGFLCMLKAVLLLTGQHVERSVLPAKQLKFHDFVPRSAVQSAQLHLQEHPRRKSRGFQFSSDAETINIEFEVFVPLVKLPIANGIDLIKRTVRRAANLHLDVLGTVVAFVLLSASLAFVLKLFDIYAGELKANHKTRRQLRTLEPYNISNTQPTLAMIDEQYYFDNNWKNLWTKSELDIQNCIKFHLCGGLKSLANDTRNGRAGSYQKIIDGLVSLQLIQKVLNGTVLMEVIQTAYSSDHCSTRYTACNWLSMPIDPLRIWLLNLNHFKKLF